MANPIAVPGTVVPGGAAVSPGGAQGIQGVQGPAGPNAVSADAGNVATIGSDSKILVPQASVVPTGSVIDYAGPSAPAGWLLCNGAAISRTTYATLYTALGGAASPWGQGDGSTTFNLPDLRSRVSVGAGQGSGLTNRVVAATGGEENHVLSVAELAAHNHTASSSSSDSGHTHQVNLYAQGWTATGAQAGGNLWYSTQVVNASTSYAAITTTTSVANTGSGAGHNTMSPFAVMNKIIKT